MLTVNSEMWPATTGLVGISWIRAYRLHCHETRRTRRALPCIMRRRQWRCLMGATMQTKQIRTVTRAVVVVGQAKVTAAATPHRISSHHRACFSPLYHLAEASCAADAAAAIAALQATATTHAWMPATAGTFLESAESGDSDISSIAAAPVPAELACCTEIHHLPAQAKKKNVLKTQILSQSFFSVCVCACRRLTYEPL
jgi:hypothetical protein